MAIQDQIDRITNEVSSQTELIDQIKEALQGKGLPPGGGGSGIIDVAELPTENIDENAIYRITTQFEDPPYDFWIVEPDGIRSMRRLIGTDVVIYVYVVNELPADMKQLDLNDTVLYVYIIESTGIGYLNLQTMGVITVGTIFIGSNEFDKGWTEDPYSIDLTDPLNYGIYTTRAVLKDFIRLYSYKNSEWTELTAHVNDSGIPISISGEYSVGDIIEVKKASETVNIPQYILTNKSLPIVVVNAPSPASLIVGDVTEITKDFFGDYYEYIGNIRNFAFAGQFRLRSIDLPDSITQIGNYAFCDCSNLICEVLPSNVEHIGYYAFSDCTNLALLSLPVGLEYIEAYSFNDCINLALTEINLRPRSDGGISYIGPGAFHQCVNMPLAKITCDNLNYIDAYAFYNCQKLVLTELPDTIESIQKEAFAHCVQMKLTKFPRNLTNIGLSAFSDCQSLTDIAFSENIQNIDTAAFASCSKLRRVVICGDLTIDTTKIHISDRAFSNCDKLIMIWVPWDEGDVPGAPWGATNATIDYGMATNYDAWTHHFT